VETTQTPSKRGRKKLAKEEKNEPNIQP